MVGATAFPLSNHDLGQDEWGQVASAVRVDHMDVVTLADQSRDPRETDMAARLSLSLPVGVFLDQVFVRGHGFVLAITHGAMAAFSNLHPPQGGLNHG